MNVTAHAERSGSWWAISVPEVPGVFTQARRLEQVPEMVREAVRMLTSERVEEVGVVTVTSADEAVAAAREARLRADAAAQDASAKMRQAVRQLASLDLTVRDTGSLLGISPQRVSQLAGKR